MHKRFVFLLGLVAFVMLAAPFSSIQNNNFQLSGSDNAFIPSHGRLSTLQSLYDTAVNPYALYSSEPAPMGIADYGVGPNNSPYFYNTNSFLGTANISSLQVSGSNGNSMTFQLNVNLQFGTTDGNTYVYWIQDVAFIDTSNGPSSGGIQFIDNVWNMSSVTANMLPSSITGNGTVSNPSGGYYYDIASPLPGNLVTLTYPLSLKLKVISYESYYEGNFVPAVAFMYNDGFGWQTYDNVLFQFAASLSYDNGFVVSGYQYNPYGTYYDAELIMGGPGGGSSTTDLSSNLDLSLEFNNGFNYQEITNAYDFGSDTAETISNVNDIGYYYISDGQLFLKADNGTGTLSRQYSSAFTTWMTIVSSIYDGYLYINGINFTQFYYGYVNITLAPGTYSFEIWNPETDSFVQVGSGSITLISGQGQIYEVNSYPVTFLSTGLPSGTTWSVTLNNVTESTDGDSITFYAITGFPYSYTVSTPAQYAPTPESGSFDGPGTSYNIQIQWSPIDFTVTLQETGLPSGSFWSSDLNFVSAGSSSNQITYTEPSGVYSFIVYPAAGYQVYPSAGTLDLVSNITLQITFVPYSDNSFGVVDQTLLLNNNTRYNGEYFSLIPQTQYPLQDVYDPQNNYLYVASAFSSNVTVINAQDNSIINEISLGRGSIPIYMVLNILNNELYVSTESGNIIIISAAQNTVLGSISSTGLHFITGLAIDSANGNLLVTAGYNLTVFSQNGYVIDQISLGASSYAYASAYINSTNSIVVAYLNGNGVDDISVYNSNLQLTGTFSLGTSSSVRSILYDQYNNDLYLMANNQILTLNASNMNLVRTILPDGIPYYSTIDPYTRDIYAIVALNSLGLSYFNLTVIDGSTNSIVSEIPLPYGSLFPAYDRTSQNIYITDEFTDSVYIFAPEHFYSINLTESSLPTETTWYVNLSNGQSYSTSGRYIVFFEPNGNYTYTLSTVNKSWSASSYTNALRVSGSDIVNPVKWDEVIYKVVFTEHGLASGTDWYVLIGGQNISGTANSNISVYLINGTYQYSIGNVAGYTLSGGSGSAMIDGSGANVSVNYKGITTVSPTLVYAAIGGIAAVAVAIGLFAVFRRKR